MQEQNEPIFVDVKLTVGLPLTLERGNSKATTFGLPSLGYADVLAGNCLIRATCCGRECFGQAPPI
jgi:hypothetical protein